MGDEGEVEELEALSPEEKLEIAREMAMKSPPGQLKEVLGDLTRLLGPELMSEQQRSELARAYNTSAWKVVQVGAGESAPIVAAPEGELGPTSALDTHTSKVVSVDHLNATAQSVPEEASEESGAAGEDALAPPHPPTSVEEERAAVEAAVMDYLPTRFEPAQISACSVYAVEGGEGGGASAQAKLVVHISAENINLRNWWAGSWSSRFEVSLTPAEGGGGGGGSCEACGLVAVKGHYFENGNMQLQTRKPVKRGSFEYETTSSLASAVVAFISKAEDTLYADIGEVYGQVAYSTLRSLRRTQTVTKSLFSWNINEIRMRSAMRKSAKA